jgi:ribosomal protein S18 acetylase RimI-like enzyme
MAVATQTYEVNQLGVRAEARRRGIVRALIQCVLAQARVAGVSEVTLKSWSFNEDAQQAFRRVGFRPEVVQFVINS